MLEYPARRKYMIRNDQIWEIVCLTEKQGGDKACAIKINQIFDELVAEHDM